MENKYIYMPPDIEKAAPDSPKKLHWRLRYVNRIARRIVDKNVGNTGLHHSQHRMLMVISDAPDISQKELAQRMEITTAAVATGIKKLISDGYIERTDDERDARAKKLKLTAKGNDTVEKSKEMFEDIHRNIYKGFDESELKLLAQFLERMCHNTTSYYEEKR